MKKILNEWRTFLKETDPKHPPKRNPTGPYDRSQTVQVQSTTAGPMQLIRTLMTQYFGRVSSHDVGHKKNYEGVIHHIDQLDPVLRDKLFEDIKVLEFIYSNRNRTGYDPSGYDESVFNDTHAEDVSYKLKNIMNAFGIPSLQEDPDLNKVQEVFKFYVMPHNYSSFNPEPEPEPEPPTDFMKDMFGSMFKEPEPKPSRFSHALNIDPEMQKRMDKLEAEREARIRASKYKRRK